MSKQIDYQALAQKYVGFRLNSEQESAIHEIVEWVNNPLSTSKYMILGGYAGTGKSSITKIIVKSLGNISHVLTAPTNKAVKVLKNINETSDCMTIYSLLGLKMEQSEDKMTLEKALRDKVGRYDLIILDECGMVNSELLAYINEVVSVYGCKVLFVGDPAQLNPIGEPISSVWGNYPLVKLTKVERHDNQVLDFVTEIRTVPIRELKIRNANKDGEGVFVCSHKEFMKQIEEAATSGKFVGSETRALAWRNKTVDDLNKFIRNKIFGDSAKEIWLKNDLVVFTSPFGENNEITVDDEGVILSATVTNHKKLKDIKIYSIDMRINDEYNTTIPVIHPDSKDSLNEKLMALALEAKNLKMNKEFKKASLTWKKYWEMKNSFADIRYGYALTVHRAQGSTYTNVYVDVNDILSNGNVRESRRCLYVAATRPSKNLYLSY